MLDIADREWSVLNVIFLVSVPYACTQRVGESTGDGALHRKKKENQKQFKSLSKSPPAAFLCISFFSYDSRCQMWAPIL